MMNMVKLMRLGNDHAMKLCIGKILAENSLHNTPATAGPMLANTVPNVSPRLVTNAIFFPLAVLHTTIHELENVMDPTTARTTLNAIMRPNCSSGIWEKRPATGTSCHIGT